MPNNRTRRLRPSILQEDLDAFAALRAIPDYRPANPVYATENINAAKVSMETRTDAEVQATAAADAARDDATAAEWDFHDMILGMKDQVKAQFGSNSNELQALGLKKKSEYRSGRRKPAGGTTAAT